MGKQLKFRPKADRELIDASDDDLIEYVVDARDAGETGEMSAAIGIFAYRREAWIMNRLKLKNVPEGDREQIFMEVVTNTFSVSFKGVSPGELFNLMRTITQRRIADYFEALSKQPDTVSGKSDSDDFFADIPGGDRDVEAVELSELVEGLIAENAPAHQQAIRLRIDGYPSKEVARMLNDTSDAETAMTPANVDQIFSRFRKELRKILGEIDG